MRRQQCLLGILFLLLSYIPLSTFSQDKKDTTSSLSIPTKISDKYIHSVAEKSAKISSDMEGQTEKYLNKLQYEEARIEKKLSKVDSLAAHTVFNNSAEFYSELQNDLRTKSERLLHGSGQYISWLDSAGGTLKFLQSNPIAGRLSGNSSQINSALSKVHALEDQFKQAENIKAFIRQRKEYLKQQLATYNFGSELKNYNQTAYYYAEQVNELHEAMDDPTKLEQKALALLNKIPAFQDFMKKNSMLAGLFNIPDDYGSLNGIGGLQTRDGVQQLLQQKLTTGGANAMQSMQQNLQSASTELSQLRNKIGQTGSGGEMPDFKPNNQKTKSFNKRLEYGVNIQTTKNNYFFPTTTDIGLSAGYKINDKSTAGIGFSYKMGWGTGLNHIAISSQGIGLRSFVDIKLKGSFYFSGGYEENYQQPFQSFQQISSFHYWQQSGLVGVSKIVSIKSKMFKKTKLQLLWDLLSYEQVPRTQPIKFRMGYNF